MKESLVLVVDDDPVVVRIVSSLLAKEYQVITASDGSEAFPLMQKNQLDLLITDLHMPNMDGFELIRIARTSLPSLPIIVITKYDSEENIYRSWKSGAFDLVEKPISPERLLSSAETALGICRSRESDSAAEISPLTEYQLSRWKVSPTRPLDPRLTLPMVRESIHELEILTDRVLVDFDPRKNYQRFQGHLLHIQEVANRLGALSLCEICSQIHDSIVAGEVINRCDLKALESIIVKTRLEAQKFTRSQPSEIAENEEKNINR